MFASCTLKSNELNYGVVEKEVLVLLRILDLGYNMLVGRQIQVLTKHSTLAWLFRSTGLQGRLGQWAALLSPWTLAIVKCKKGEDDILGVIAASITSRTEVDLVLARSGYAEGLTVNDAEYHGLLLCLDQLEGEDRRRLIICGDSNLVIRQVRGEIDCKVPGLTLLRQTALNRLRIWPDHDLVHVRRDRNGSADRLASAAVQRQAGIMVEDEADLLDLVTLNRLDKILKAASIQEVSVACVVPVTTGSRAGSRLGGSGSDGSRSSPEVLGDEIVRELRISRLRQAQDEEAWISGLKTYLAGRIQQLTQDEAKSYSKISMDYDFGRGSPRDWPYVPADPEPFPLERYRSVQHYVGECVDCETGKGRSTIQGESPGNIQATYPFQVIAMDHIPSLPRSFKGNTELLIWVDLFSGYVIPKASGSRTAQTIVESYEECTFRRFGASEVIRHDREPGLMADFFRSFNRNLGQRQRATMAYRPQANGTAERMVQTATRALKVYVQHLDQRDWDDYAERLTFAINTAQDRIRGETPFYLVHGWDPRSTLEAPIPVGSTCRQDRDPRRWRYQIQRHHRQARAQVNERLREAIADRADSHNETARPHQIEAGSRVWLYLDRVKEGYAHKLAHMWHGPLRVVEKVEEFAVRIEVAGTEYRLLHSWYIRGSNLVSIDRGRDPEESGSNPRSVHQTKNVDHAALIQLESLERTKNTKTEMTCGL
ncbi:unnamed protein product [Phytophthora fragariaefolia]|uniref:Unnamed protein product n=1 Tax=Phytophthora fragariaefolia TaxID=1490495 RepID=A0A9W6UCF7_9STRA|nr:unnamed protein product [Phytophthora fragariaefolia]